MKGLRGVLTGLGVILLAVCLTAAGDSGGVTRGTAEQPPEDVIIRASGITAYTLVGRDGEELGRGHDLLIDAAQGTLAYVIFDFPLPGMENKLVPIPLASMALDPESRTFKTSLNEDTVRNSAPGLGAQRFPDALTGVSAAEDRRYVFWYNLSPVRTPAGYIQPDPNLRRYALGTGMRVVPGSQVTFKAMRDVTVLDREDRPVGSIEDLIVDLVTGEVLYTMFATTRTMESDYHTIPLSLFTIDFEESEIVFDSDPRLLQDAPVIEGDYKVTGRLEVFDRNVYSYWNDADVPVHLRAGMRVIPQETIRLTELIGYDVTNHRDEVLGTIVDFVVTQDGDVPFAVLESDGVSLFTSDRWYFIPPSAFTLDQVRYTAVLGLSEEFFQNMPSFQKGTLPAVGDPDWETRIQDYWRDVMRYGAIMETGSAERAGRIHLANDVLGYEVINPEGQSLGHVEDFMMDVGEADIVYAALSFGGFLGIGDDLFALPMKLLDIRPFPERIVLDVDRRYLEEAQGFTEDDGWPERPADRWLVMAGVPEE